MRVVKGLALAASLVALAGCGGGGASAVRNAPAGTATTASTPSSASVGTEGNSTDISTADGKAVVDQKTGDVSFTDAAGAKATTTPGLPQGFPTDVPIVSGASVVGGLVTDDHGATTYLVTLDVQDAKAAYEYYRSALPPIGWQVGSLYSADSNGTFVGGFTVTSAHYSGELTFATPSGAKTLAVSLTKTA